MMTDPLRTALLSSRVPRYTSYPPANRFTAAVGPEDCRDWLGAVPAGAAISLYVHVPFCRRLCYFCACRTQGTRSDAPLDRYLAHLALEIGLVRAALPAEVAVSALHLGGGTPTILSAARLDRLAAALRGAFRLAPGAEISAEIDPTDCDEARLDALLRLGLNRASIGVQDFAPQVQAAIGREQSAEATGRTVAQLRARGIDSVNFDLLYGLPYQTAESLAATLDTALALRPDRIALYGYAHVPWMARRQRLIAEPALPDPETRLALAAAARERLVAAGYVGIGIDHFARPGDSMARAAAEGRLRRNFQGYTTDGAETLVGLGPSAISRFPQGYAQNLPGTGDWQAALAAGRLATARGHALSDTDRLVGAAIERLMCDGTADLGGLAGAGAATLRARARAALAEIPALGRIEGDRLISASPAGARLLAARLDPGFAPAPELFSLAS